jgi:hypothetical protein
MDWHTSATRPISFPPRSAAAAATVAHDVGGGYRNVGGYPLHHFPSNTECAHGQGRIPTSPRASSLTSPSPVSPCPPSVVPPSVATRSRRRARKRTERQRCRLQRLGNVVARRGAATRRPWRLLRRGPPPLLPLPPRPGQLGLLAMRAFRRGRGPVVQRGAGGNLLPQWPLLLRRPAVAGGRRAAKTRRPLLSSGSPPPPPRSPAWRPLLRWARRGPGW